MKQKRIPDVWFWRPELYWHGWKTLIPFFTGGDEYNRHTFVLGWTITGRMIVAYKRCNPTCDGWLTPEEMEKWYEEDEGSKPND